MKYSIKIKYMEGVEPLEGIFEGDWVDLRCAKTMCIQRGEKGVIPLGVAMQLPKGFEALVLPRSSTFKRYGIIMTNGCGVIDECYNGDNDFWGFPFLATRDCVITANSRIAQFRIIKHQPTLVFEEVKKLNNQNRGGFGSTGV